MWERKVLLPRTESLSGRKKEKLILERGVDTDVRERKLSSIIISISLRSK